MKLTISREVLLRPLQLVAGVIEKRQTLPVLSNLLMRLQGNQLSMTGTDLEVELVGRALLDAPGEDGEVTIPARKFFDICRSLPESASITITTDGSRVVVRSGKSRFTLSTLPAADFPTVEESTSTVDLTLQSAQLKRLIDRTAFSMAQQDVRYYLNGMLFELGQGYLRAVATDGHRLALCTQHIDASRGSIHHAILPRKGVIELLRLLADSKDELRLQMGSNYLRASLPDFTFTSKLIDGKFPDYDRVLPKGGNKRVLADRQQLRLAFNRAAILSNEKYRGVRLTLAKDLLTIVASNPEQEEAEEQVSVDYAGDSLEIGFNISYLAEVLGVLSEDKAKLTFSDANSSVLVEENNAGDSLYVVMPMRL